MVQTLAALLSWIAILALISIAVLVSGIWRPRASAASHAAGASVHPLQTAAQSRVQIEAVAEAQARRTRQAERRAA